MITITVIVIAAAAFAFIVGAAAMTHPYDVTECTCVDVDDENLGVQIPDAMLARMGLKLGDPVEIEITDAGVITIRKPS